MTAKRNDCVKKHVQDFKREKKFRSCVVYGLYLFSYVKKKTMVNVILPF